MRVYRRCTKLHFGDTAMLNVISRGQFAQDLFTLRSTFLEGRPPKSVNMYWRRIKMSTIPLDDPEEFQQWLICRWREKDGYLERYVNYGRFSADPGISTVDKSPDTPALKSAGIIETEVKLVHWGEIGQIFGVLLVAALISKCGADIWNWFMYGNVRGHG